MREWTFAGYDGARAACRWEPHGPPRYVALLCHGYGEHIGRYEQVASVLCRDGAVVYGMDHAGHGRSAGERVLIADYEEVVTDFHVLVEHAVGSHPGFAGSCSAGSPTPKRPNAQLARQLLALHGVHAGQSDKLPS